MMAEKGRMSKWEREKEGVKYYAQLFPLLMSQTNIVASRKKRNTTNLSKKNKKKLNSKTGLDSWLTLCSDDAAWEDYGKC